MAYEKFLVFVNNRQNKPSTTSTEIQVSKIDLGASKVLDNSTVVLQGDLSGYDTHVSGDGSDHANVATNTTHISSNGSDHSYIGNLQTLSGVAAGSTHLAAFSGTTIPDNQTIKAALQALETAVESVTDDQDATEVPYTPTTAGDWVDPDPTEVGGALDDLADRVTVNDTHVAGSGSDHADVATNTTHSTGNGADHGNVATNTTHSTGDGSDHANVATNTTHISSDGSDHSDVVTNSTHSAGDGTDHTGLLSKAGGSMNAAANITLSSAGEILGLPGTPTTSGSATSKSYVDSLAITGGIVKEALLLSEQMDDTDGINAAGVMYITTIPIATDTFILKDDATTETFEFKAAEAIDFDVEIGADAEETMTNLAAAINADSVKWDAKYTTDGLDSINTDGVVVIYEKSSAAGTSDSRMYGVWDTQADCSVVEYDGETEYLTSKAAITLPAADPTAGTFGLRKQVSALVNGEIHLALESDELKSWNEDATAWLTLSGSGSLPDATSASGGGIKGKVTFDSDKGLSVSSGVAEVLVDDSSIGFSGGNLIVKPTGVTNAMLAGSIEDSKLNTITTADKVSGSAVQLASNSGLEDSTGLKVSDVETFENDGGGATAIGDAGFIDTDGKFTFCGAGTTDIYKKELIFANEVIANTASGNFVTRDGGIVTVAGAAFTVGEEVYLSSTSKQVTQSAAGLTSGHEVIIVGYARSTTTFRKCAPNNVGQAE